MAKQSCNLKTAYIEKCKRRWYGVALKDAFHNWKTWKEMDEYLRDAMQQYIRNTGQVDARGEYHNPDHSLSGFLWNCQEALQKRKSNLYPFIDFEEHYQRFFLRRGLLIYCELILNELENKHKEPCSKYLINT